MPTEVIMPALGMAQETGKVVRWLRAEGDLVGKGEPLIEVETDKVTVEIEAPAAGTLAGLRAAEGDDVPVGLAVAFILADGEAVPARPAPPPASVAESHSTPISPAAKAPETGPRRALASPKARRLAEALGVPIDQIAGSGPRGEVVAADIEAFAASPAAPPPPAGGIEVSSAWRTMAERMQRSWQEAPHFYLQREVDASALNGRRDAALRTPGLEGVTHTDLLVKIAAAALREHPRVNASWLDGTIAVSEPVNIGIAVATDDVLIVPVIHGADRLDLGEIASRRGELVARARERKLRPEDVTGGTFTISNLGMFGVDAFAAIVNAPQAAILAVGRIADRVVAVDGEPAVRPTCVISLSFDHRVVDGAAGARFLDTLASLLEEPAGLVG